MNNSDFGSNLKFYNDFKPHSPSNQTELIYVLEGKATASIAENRYKLFKDDIILINYGQEYDWKQQADTLVCVISISKDMIRNETGASEVSFRLNSAADKDVDYKEIKSVVGNLIVEYTEDSNALSARKKSLFYSLFDILFNRYVIERKSLIDVLSTDEQFLSVLEYINDNYDRHLSLSDAAGFAFMTDSAFSRYFKKNSGVNYLEYLNRIRLRKATEELLYTNKSLTEIALNNGFTDLAMFSKAFRKFYDMSPSEYKKNKKEKNANKQPETVQQNEDEYHSRLIRFVDDRRNRNFEDVFRKRISVNTGSFQNYKKIWNTAINIGEASDLLMADMQKNVLELKNNLGFTYVRLVNVFGWNMHLRQDRSYKKLNFDLLDNVLDFIFDNGMKPILDFGDKPRRLMLDIDSIISLGDSIHVFESVGEARWLIENLINHVVDRYGVQEVENWIFEFWYDKRDENLNEDGYLEMFDQAYSIIKSQIPAAKFGGCGLELGADDRLMLKKWKSAHCLPDFISLAAFPYVAKHSGFGTEDEKNVRSTDPHFIYNELTKFRQILAESGMENIPVMLTEWNLSMSDRNYYNDSCGKAAQMLMNMTECLLETDLGVYLFGTDLNSRYYDTSADFYGGAGLLTKSSLAKPAFYALKFMGQLGNVLLQRGEGFIATKNVKDEFVIVVYNHKKFNYNYYTKKENEIRVDDVARLFSDDDPIEIEIELNGVPNGQYQIKTENLGISCGGLVTAWRDLGGAPDLDRSEREYLKRISIPRIQIRKQNAEGGRLTVSETLDAHDIRLIKIRKQ